MDKQVIRILLIMLIPILVQTGCVSTNSTQSDFSSSKTESTKPIDSSAKDSTSTVPGSISLDISTAQPHTLGKVLIVYYSLTGTTSKVAGALKEMTGGDVFEIQSEFDYYRQDVEEIAKKHINEGYKPGLKNSVSNIDSYDVIFVGSPVWWSSVAPPVVSFLSQYDLKDKKVVPFCTCKTVYSGFFEKFEDECNSTKVLKGRNFFSRETEDIEKLKQTVETWLTEIEKGG